MTTRTTTFIALDVTILRKTLLDGVAKTKAQGADAFVRYARGEEKGDFLPCWGALAERFDTQFPQDADRLEVWKTMLEHPDRRAMLLFLDVNRGRDAVLAKVMADAGSLPEDVQVALVTMPETQSIVASYVGVLGPAARLLWQQGPAAIRKEARLTETRMQKLRQLYGTRLTTTQIGTTSQTAATTSHKTST